MKKVGICTLCNANNFGAILQAFSLQETVKEMGHEVEFIKLKSEHFVSSNKNKEGFDRSRKFLNMSEKEYDKENDNYDTIIVGSDEVWNLNNNTFEHLDEYFGYNLNSKKIISYAPSANGTNKEDFEKYYGNKIDFSKFDFLSARDKGTKKLIKDVSNREASLVVDPTLLVESFDKYIKYNDELKDYIILYGYYFSEEEKQKIQKFAKEQNKKIYSLAYKLDWCDVLEADIFEFLGYIKNADYVVTNTFHGLVFSFILEKEFCVFSNKNDKVIDFMNNFSLAERDAVNVENLNKIFEKEVNYEISNKIKVEKRKESLEYLKNSI